MPTMKLTDQDGKPRLRTARTKPSRQRPPTAIPTKPWTVLVWLAGDNNLESFALTDLEEMKRVGSTDHVNIVAQLDTMADDRTRRYFLRRGTSVQDDVVEELGETNTGDPAVAIDFFVWAMQQYPSERVLAVIWNHGSGIDEADLYARAARGVSAGRAASRSGAAVPSGNVRTMMSRRYRRALFSTTLDTAMSSRGIAYDDSSRDFLDNAELKRVFEQVKSETGRAIDLLGFDACLMNMVEIAYQLRTTAGFIVGSEEIEPGDGWPYDKVLADLAAKPTLSAEELGVIVVKRYAASYASETVTQSLLDLDRVKACAAAVDDLAAALIKALKKATEYAAVTKALNATLRFDMEEFVDLGHLCSELATRSKDYAVKKAAKAVLEAISGPDGLVAAEAHKGRTLNEARGVAIYVPRGAPAKTYSKGLEAMMPGSPLVLMLNRPNVKTEADLHVLGGDVEGAGLFGRLKTLATDLYYRDDHDLVVNTPAMLGGTERSQPIRYWIDTGPSARSRPWSMPTRMLSE